jgi:hypothetical protein
MQPKITTSQTYSGLENAQINKLSLEKAELKIILELKNNALRCYKHQLQAMNRQKVGRPFKYCRDLILLATDLETLSILTGFIGDAQTADMTLFRPAFHQEVGLPRMV